MFKLTIGGSGCVISDFEKDTYCFYTFDATTEIFDIMNENCGLVRYMLEASENDKTLSAAQNIIDEVVNNKWELADIEATMGSYGVSFPIVNVERALMCKCENIASVVLSVLHFLFLNGYKLSHCNHCGKLYATKNLKVIYCNRNSTYSGYEKYSCKNAVKHINDSLEKRRKTVYERLRVRAEEYGYHSKFGETFRHFQDTCTKHKEQIKKNASVVNLEEYSFFLQNGEGLPKRYERIKDVIR